MGSEQDRPRPADRWGDGVVLAGANRILFEGFTARTEAEAAGVCLAVAQEMTGAAFGFVGEIDLGADETESLSINGWSAIRRQGSAGPEAPAAGQFTIRDPDARLLRQGMGVLANGGRTNGGIEGPAGAPALDSFLAAPLILDGGAAGVVGLGGREGGFGPQDLERLEALAPAILQALRSKRTEMRQGMLLRELQHRVRNILGMVRAVVRRSAETATDVTDLGRTLDGRINALARIQSTLMRAAGAGVDLELLVREELLAQSAHEDLVRVEGPRVMLGDKAAEVLTLAIHELATNSTKYGAIGRDGRLEVTWSVQPQTGADWLTLAWTETAPGPIPVGEPKRGFGVELIQERVPYELRGRGRVDLRPSGLLAEIAFPLTEADSLLSTGAP